MSEPHFGYSGNQIAHAVSLDTHANRFVAASAANHVKLSDPVTLGDAVADLADANADNTITLCDSYKIAVPAMVELGDWEAQHQHNEDEVDELVRRLAELEKRVEAVEQFRGIGGH